MAREFVHWVQQARKKEDLDYADRIRVAYEAGAEMKAAVDAHLDWIKGETLAVEVVWAAGGAAGEPSIRIEKI